MRRSIFAVAVLVLAVSLFGCGREPDTGFLRVHNAGTVTINYFYLVPSNSPDWGNDRLGGDLSPNFYFYISELIPGSYDARAVAVLDSTYYAYFYSALSG